jgi:hypothetical protein
MESFYKTKDCPASEKLAMLADHLNDTDEFSEHLSECEFCTAEMEFYRRHPPEGTEQAEGTEQVEPSNIPQPLLELADALLLKRRDLSELYKLAGKYD